jgi:hypothetical protein
MPLVPESVNTRGTLVVAQVGEEAALRSGTRSSDAQGAAIWWGKLTTACQGFNICYSSGSFH